MNIIDTPTKRVLKKRDNKPISVVLHSTGETDLDKILAWYTHPEGLGPHYFIETIGTVRRIAAENLIAYHAKIDKAEANLYQMGYQYWSQWIWLKDKPVNKGEEQSNYRLWRETWRDQGKQSPLDLVTKSSPNTFSVGIELQQPTSPTADIFTDEQYDSLTQLLIDIGKRNDIALDREHILGHYDVSPMRRSNSKGSWDPGEKFSFNRLFDLITL